MKPNTVHRIWSVAAGILLLGGLILFGACFFTAWDGKWFLGFFMVLGFVGITAYADRPELTR